MVPYWLLRMYPIGAIHPRHDFVCWAMRRAAEEGISLPRLVSLIVATTATRKE